MTLLRWHVTCPLERTNTETISSEYIQDKNGGQFHPGKKSLAKIYYKLIYIFFLMVIWYGPVGFWMVAKDPKMASDGVRKCQYINTMYANFSTVQNGPLSWGENFICCTSSTFSVPLTGPTSLTTVSLMIVAAPPNDEFIFETNNPFSLCFISPEDWSSKCVNSYLGKRTAKTSWASSNWILVLLEFQYQSLFIPHLK